MSFFDVVGLVSGVVGIISFASDKMPVPPGANVIVRFGIGTGVEEGLGGTTGPIYGFDVNNSPVGRFDGGASGEEGATIKVIIDQSAGVGVDIERVNYIGTEGDAVCISYLAVANESGNKWAWLGDVGQLCGQPTFAGNVVVNNDDNYRCRCTWIGGPLGAEGGAISASYKVNMPFYTAAEGAGGAEIDLSKTCDNTQWSTAFSPTGKRSVLKRSEKMKSQLIVSPHSAHSAGDECADPLSYGPDFLTLHNGVYCDMETKTPYPLCTPGVSTSCAVYDANAKTIVLKDTVGHEIALDRNVTVWA